MTRPNVICLTPIKDEAWIIERFLKCASIWADYIIIADQNSEDGSLEIAKKFEKVIVIENNSTVFNEPERQKMLLEAARKIPSPRLLVALDADEFLTPNFIDSPEWETALNSPKGTVICFKWANLCPDMRHYWTPEVDFPWGFMDDGSLHEGRPIHSTRVPYPSAAPVIKMRSVRVMHYQYTDWDRMQSKHRWYMAWERIKNPKISAVTLYRQYHHMYAVQAENIKEIPEWWINNYEKLGIDMTTILKDRPYRWDGEVIRFIREHGASLFSCDKIWDVNWVKIAVNNNLFIKEEQKFSDPRNYAEKIFHLWMEKSQYYSNSFLIKLIDSILRKFI
jgi:hypothetical protein